jgi:uncharacterized protein DUF4410
MFLKSTSSRGWATVLLFAIAVPLMAARKAPVTPGRYEGWGPDIDKVEIVKTFRLSSYAKVVVVPLDVFSVAEKGDADLADKVASVLIEATPPFFEGVRKELTKIPVVEEGTSVDAGVLIVRGKITVMDPGSRSKRMWVGYGAGAARTAIEGEIVDAQTGEVFVRFTQERRSGIDRFGKGSSYEEIMKRNLSAVGRDVAHLLSEF